MPISNVKVMLASPTQLVASVVSGTVRLAWRDNCTVELTQQVQRQTNGGAWVALSDAAANVITYTDSDVSAGNTYTYRVRAKKNTSYSAWSATASATVPAAVDEGRAKRGILTGYNAAWQTDWPWSNLINFLKPWGTPTNPWADASIPVDTDGAPLADCGGGWDFKWIDPGTYNWKFTGSGTLTWTTSAKSPTYVTDVDGMHGTVVLDSAANTAFKITGINAANPPRNLRVVKSDQNIDSYQTFRQQFLDAFAPFGIIRTVNWGEGNYAKYKNPPLVRNWSERTLPGHCQTTMKGVAYEHMIALANATSCDLWICLPALASDAYLTSLASLVSSTLNAERKVYLEWSNEVWNSGLYPQYAAILAEAASNTELLPAMASNGVALAYQQTANRLREAGQIFAAAIGDRARTVFAGQGANPWILEQGLKYLVAKYGNCSSMWGISYADYFQPTTYATLYDAFASLNSVITSAIRPGTTGWGNQGVHLAYVDLATKYSITHRCCYEAGQHIIGTDAVKLAMQTDPRMGDAYRTAIAQRVASGLDFWNETNGPIGLWGSGSSGYWGLKQLYTDATHPKWDAAAE